ncbi:VOC family protein [Woodsholea maritima]|uniref:VOC family protein n=1 Tax=Woodsholea maritima TaxID=240237 RepID=UPI00036C4A9C|nr:VOC family protein [Woodsholea maritima]
MSAPSLPGLSPYLCVRQAKAAIAFYEKAFGAEVLELYDHEDMVMHATLALNGSILMLADEFPEMETQTGNIAPDSLDGRTTTTLTLNVDDTQAWFDRAISAGASVIREPKEEFFGLHGKLRDPFGHVWSIMTLKRENQAL